MTRRYFYADPWEKQVRLTENEAHHLLHVMREKVGDEVELFNGRGEFAQARVLETKKSSVLLELSSEVQAAAELTKGWKLSLATAVPKGDRFRWLIEKGTELGIDKLIPLNTSRSVVNPRESKLDKQQQYVVEACKQSGRNCLLEIAPVQSLDDLLNSVSEQTLLLAGVLSEDFPPHPPALLQKIQQAEEILLLVGPEGGFTADEKSQLKQHQAEEICCAPHVLRTETAGLALASLVSSLKILPAIRFA